jgi:hypothetical protein
MGDWRLFLKADPTDWLLQEDNPSVRYFTLTGLLGKIERNSGVKQVKRQIMEEGVVPRILAKQEEGGYWGIPGDFYVRSKYRGTVWQIIILAESGADARDKRIRKACEFILENSQDRNSGGFAYSGSPEGGGDSNRIIPCLTGNMVWSLIRLGYLEDPRVKRGIEWISTYQRFDDGTGAPKGWPYDGQENCWGNHTCHMGVVKSLKALAEIQPRQRSAAVKKALGEGGEYLLRHHIYKSSHDLDRIAKKEWLRFGFPLMWKTDALEILGLLVKLGYKDRRMQEAMDLVLAKQDEEGRWLLEKTFNGRFITNIERKDKQSKWVTLHALKAIKGYYQ